MGYVRVMQLASMLAAAMSSGAAQGAAPAEANYPTRPVRLIVPFTPGGTNDILARMIANHLSDRLGKTVIVDNRPGADGVIGTDIVAKGNPDGYTLIILSAAYAMNPAVRKLPYDPNKAVDFVMKLGAGPTVLSVGPALQVDSVKSLFAVAKSKPGQVIFGTSGGFQYFATALLRTLSGHDFNIVLYKGTFPALIDVIGGQTHASIAPVVPSLPHLKSGKLRALAMGTLKRSSMLPEVATLDELGVSGYDASNWYTIATSPGTPQAIVSKLYSEIGAYMRSPETVRVFTGMGGEVDIKGPEEMRTFIAAEIAKWTKVAIDAKMPREVN
ncbi:MAG: tripartite tricarboxylate transporter substrate binding protein [Burkholderiales bacterium]|nr:tripartite tricarboxylate transporter substrate binding protein [Burkholderiales bacterium]